MIVTPLKDKVNSKGYASPTKVLSAGEHYFVYAIEKKGNKTWFYILDDAQRHLGCPFVYEADLFSIVDLNIPQGWVTSHFKEWFRKVEFTSFPEWANDARDFYARLFESEPNYSERKLIDKYYARYETRTTPPQT